MVRMWKKLGIFLLFYLMTLMGCSSVNGSFLEPKPLPPLGENVPYDSLGNGRIMFHRIGPDAEYVAFYVMDVTHQEEWGFWFSGAESPEISPDGRAVLFSMYVDPIDGRDIMMTDIRGETLINVSAMLGNEYFPTWGPSMEFIYFWGPGYYAPILYEQEPSNNYYSRSPIYQFMAEYNGKNYPLEPSGKVDISSQFTMVFATNRLDSIGLNGIYLIHPSQAKIIQVYHPVDGWKVESPVFSPNGDEVAFIEIDRDSSFYYHSMKINILNLSTEEVQTIIQFPLQAQNEWIIHGKDNPLSICWSPDGSRLLFNKPEGDFVSHLYLIDRTGQNLTQITKRDSVYDTNPSWGLSEEAPSQ